MDAEWICIHLVHSSKAHFSGCSELDSRIALIEYYSKRMYFLHLKGMPFLSLYPLEMKINFAFGILSTLNLNKYFEWKFNKFSNSISKELHATGSNYRLEFSSVWRNKHFNKICSLFSTSCIFSVFFFVICRFIEFKARRDHLIS